jgi:hypothetical protein
VSIGELEKYVKEALTSGELQRQHVVSIIHQPISFCNFVAAVYNYRDMWWRGWFRHCATSRKIAGLIPDDLIGTLH